MLFIGIILLKAGQGSFYSKVNYILQYSGTYFRNFILTSAHDDGLCVLCSKWILAKLLRLDNQVLRRLPKSA